MKRTLFDKFFITFLVIYGIAFICCASYAMYSSQNSAIKERETTMINEAKLIANQSVINYYKGSLDLDELKIKFDEFEDELKMQIWMTDSTGHIIATSHSNLHADAPANIYDLDDSEVLKDGFALTGKFYGCFDETMISVGIPINFGDSFIGMLLLHSSMSNMNLLMGQAIRSFYLPFLLLLAISFGVMAVLSTKVLRPVDKLNAAAMEYAKGNFEPKVDIDLNDELGTLADSMNYMSAELHKRDQFQRDLISNISHDFRSPLTSIKGYLDAIKDGTIPPEKQGKYIDILLFETNRLTKLTQGLLDLKNFDNLELTLKRQKFNITSVITGTLDTFQVQCDKKDIDLQYYCAVENTMVDADESKIQQVVYNLLDNAIKFSPEGSVILVQITEDDEKIWISIKDQGIGIDSTTQKKVFERFYKADISRGKDKQGLGLGLSIVKEIINAHEETIILESEENQGTEFRFSLAKAKPKRPQPLD